MSGQDAVVEVGLAHQYPLRGDITVKITGLPRDLTVLESKRLAAFIQTLAADFDVS